jgi:hypothetical protein
MAYRDITTWQDLYILHTSISPHGGGGREPERFLKSSLPVSRPIIKSEHHEAEPLSDKTDARTSDPFRFAPLSEVKSSSVSSHRPELTSAWVTLAMPASSCAIIPQNSRRLRFGTSEQRAIYSSSACRNHHVRGQAGLLVMVVRTFQYGMITISTAIIIFAIKIIIISITTMIMVTPPPFVHLERVMRRRVGQVQEQRAVRRRGVGFDHAHGLTRQQVRGVVMRVHLASQDLPPALPEVGLPQRSSAVRRSASR